MKYRLILLAFTILLTVVVRLSAVDRHKSSPGIIADNSGVVEEIPNVPVYSENYLLPDLKILPPRELFVDSSDGERKLIFSTTFINQGEGPLEVLGKADLENELTYATQIIKKRDGSSEEHDIGTFILHPTHEHWHIENYVEFQLWSHTETGEKDELLETTDKMSFCIWDEEEYDLTLESASQAQTYVGCEQEMQGISVGWSDTYAADVPGQELDISEVSDGSYIVATILNGDRKIVERDYSNNEALVFIEISDGILAVSY